MVDKVNYICMSRKGASLSLSSSSLLGTGLSTDNVPVDDLWHHSLNLCTGIPPHTHMWYTEYCVPSCVIYNTVSSVTYTHSVTQWLDQRCCGWDTVAVAFHISRTATDQIKQHNAFCWTTWCVFVFVCLHLCVCICAFVFVYLYLCLCVPLILSNNTMLSGGPHGQDEDDP